MSIKIKLKEGHKAIVRFNHPVDEQYFINMIRIHRDDGLQHPKIIFKNRNNENVPKIIPPKPLPKVVPKPEMKLVKKPEVKK